MLDAIRGDLGVSVRKQVPVAALIAERAAASAILIAASMTWSVLGGIVLGILAAIFRGKLIDHTIRMVVAVAQAAPAFWVAIVLIHLLSVELRWLPASSTGGVLAVVLPAFCLGLFVLSGMTRLVRSKMLDALSQDYVLKARAMGLGEFSVVVRHAFRNVLLPVITFVGDYLAILITSAVVIETVFGWPGLGNLALEAVFTRDYPLILGVTIVIAAFIMLVNLVVDFCYGLLDPRVRESVQGRY